jgi:hypothetical protein
MIPMPMRARPCTNTASRWWPTRSNRRYDMVVLAVPHHEYLAAGAEALRGWLQRGGTLADLKGVLGEAADWTL